MFTTPLVCGGRGGSTGLSRFFSGYGAPDEAKEQYRNGEENRMLVVVCIKQVPDTTQVQIDPVTNTLVREGIPFIVNPYDTHALEEALRLKDRFGFRVAAISMGPPNAEATLKKALALGVDEAILLSDRCFGGADTLATSNVLAEAISKLDKKEAVGLVLCGKQTIDGDTAQVGPGIATRLKYTQLTLVDRIENVDLLHHRIRVRRKLEGRHEIVEAPFPAMLTVVRELNRPRYPTVPMRLASQEACVQVWDNRVLGMDEHSIGLKGSPTWVSRIFSPQRDKGEIIGDGVNDPTGTARLLVDKLIGKDLLAM
jgi:electron transfer flavoprotein beta subunit